MSVETIAANAGPGPTYHRDTPKIETHVLIVDDRPENLVALEGILADLELSCTRANSGAEALQLAREGDFALILLDVQMPGMDGFETCTRLREDPDTNDLPIIFVTAINTSPQHALQGYSVGAVDFLCKPVDPDVVEGKVRVFAEMYRQRKVIEMQARELVERNEELEDFCYVASHDLQEPLRKLTAFSDLLAADLGDDLSEVAEKDLTFIRDAAKRMSGLITDLLRLSRTARVELGIAPTDLGGCARRAIEALSVAIEESGARVIAEDLPRVPGDATLLTQLYQNLIGNALKFARAGAPPRIRLTAERAGNRWILGVQDNGIGIEPEYCSQIFAPFKRLHGRSEYPGTGIGLAICRKVVERMHGRLWVESTPGEGSHFRFELPAVAEDHETAPPD